MRKKEGDKHSAILDSAIRVFCREGFSGAQVATIAAEAGIATGSVYLYFKSKEEVLDGVFTRFWENIHTQVESLDESNPVQFLRLQLALFFDSLTENREMAEVYLHEHHRFIERKPKVGYAIYMNVVEGGERMFRKGAKAKMFAYKMEVGLGRAFLFGGVRAAVEYWLSQKEMSPRQVRNRMLQLGLASLGVKPEDFE